MLAHGVLGVFGVLGVLMFFLTMFLHECLII